MRPLRKSAAFQAVRDQYGQGDRPGPAARLLQPALHLRRPGDDPRRRGPRRRRPGRLRRRRRADPVHGRRLRHAVRLPDREPERQPDATSGRCSSPAASAPRRSFIGITIVLAPEIGAYAAPIGMLVGFGVPSLLMFARNQLGKQPHRLPLPRGRDRARDRRRDRRRLPAARARQPARARDRGSLLLVVFLGDPVPLRVIPEQPLAAADPHRSRSVRSGSAGRLSPPTRALQRARARRARAAAVAVIARLPADRLRADDGAHGTRAGRAPCAGSARAAGSRSARPRRYDAEISIFLFEDASRAVRDQSMRRLLADGAESNDLRALEDLVAELARVPDDGWEGRPSRARPQPAGGRAPSTRRPPAGDAQERRGSGGGR